MAIFEYKALNSQGRNTKGHIDADSVRSARQKLKTQGIFPTSVIETEVIEKQNNLNISFTRKKVNSAHLAVATRQLSTLVAAGMPIVEALKALGDQVEHTRLKQVLAEVCDKVNEGEYVANAMREYPKVFPRLYVNMVASGEASGTLDLVLERLADLLESQAALKRKIVSALTYPVLMLGLCFSVIVMLLAYVVPEITAIFNEQHATLPMPTQVIIALSDFTKEYWFIVLLGGGASLFFFKQYSRTEKGRKKIDRFLLKLPVIGIILLKVDTCRFARNLGSMLTSGIALLSALPIARSIIGNVIMEEAVDSATEGVREGRGLAAELNKSQVFPKLLIHMIAIGEKTGQLDSMLLRSAASYESEVEAFVSSLTSILEPILILILASIVGGILAAVMLPMLEMSSLTGT